MLLDNAVLSHAMVVLDGRYSQVQNGAISVSHTEYIESKQINICIIAVHMQSETLLLNTIMYLANLIFYID